MYVCVFSQEKYETDDTAKTQVLFPLPHVQCTHDKKREEKKRSNKKTREQERKKREI